MLLESEKQAILQKEVSRLERLRSVALWRSWSLERKNLPQFLVRQRGPMLETIVERFVEVLEEEGSQQSDVTTEVCIAGEQTNLPIKHRPIRVLSRLAPYHTGVTDVSFHAEGSDLYVKFASSHRTLITWLRLAMNSAAYLVIFSVLMGLYLYQFGAFNSWALDYAQKHSKTLYADQEKSTFLHKAITDGSYHFDNDKFVASMLAHGGAEELNHILGNREDQERYMKMAMFPGLKMFDPDIDETGPWKHWDSLIMTHQNRWCLYAMLRQWREDAFAFAAVEALQHIEAECDYVVLENKNRPLQMKIMMVSTLVDSVSSIDTLTDTPIAKLLGAEHDSELGGIVKTACNDSVEYVPAWSVPKLFLKDPRLAITNIGVGSSVLAVIVAIAVFFIPHSIIRWTCLRLRWPTPDEFLNMTEARDAKVQRILSDSLMHDFGVQEADIHRTQKI